MNIMKLKIPTFIEIEENYAYNFRDDFDNFKSILDWLVNNTTPIASTAKIIHSFDKPVYTDFFHHNQLKGSSNVVVESITILKYSDTNKSIAIEIKWKCSSAVVIAYIN